MSKVRFKIIHWYLYNYVGLQLPRFGEISNLFLTYCVKSNKSNGNSYASATSRVKSSREVTFQVTQTIMLPMLVYQDYTVRHSPQTPAGSSLFRLDVKSPQGLGSEPSRPRLVTGPKCDDWNPRAFRATKRLNLSLNNKPLYNHRQTLNWHNIFNKLFSNTHKVSLGNVF